MKSLKLNHWTRRDWLQTAPGLVLASLGISCGGASLSLDQNVRSKVKKKYHWARREEWTGEEAVVGVTQSVDRYLMVYNREGLGWTFPMQIVDPQIHGAKTQGNKDLLHAATETVYEQTLLSVIPSECVLMAYGYVFDDLNKRTLLVHWFNIIILGDHLTKPHANLSNTSEAKWIALDDPRLGGVLRMRLQEFTEAGEGNSIIMEASRV